MQDATRSMESKTLIKNLLKLHVKLKNSIDERNVLEKKMTSLRGWHLLEFTHFRQGRSFKMEVKRSYSWLYLSVKYRKIQKGQKNEISSNCII
jgi:hypothetical protein